MYANYSYYLINPESQPDWLFFDGKDILDKDRISEDNIIEYPTLPRSNVVVIVDTFDIFGFHFKSDDYDDQLKIMFYNKNGNIVIRYCGGKGRITKIDNGETVLLPIQPAYLPSFNKNRYRFLSYSLKISDTWHRIGKKLKGT